MSDVVPWGEISLVQMRDAADRAVTVATAAQAGLFTGLAAGAATPGELARRLGLDPRAVGMVLPALEQLGWVVEREGRYALSERGQRQLGDPDSPEYVGRGLPLWLESLRLWVHLDDALRTGRPPCGKGGEEQDVGALMAGMAAVPAARLRRTVEVCLARLPGARSAIDLGGGPGFYAREFARAGLDTTLFDTPEVIRYVRAAYDADHAAGVRLAAGDFLLDGEIPAGPYDVALLSNVLHLVSPAEARALLARAHRVLAPGGLVAIGETLRGRSPRAPWMGIMMLLRTERGDAYSEAQFRAWLEEVGFGDVRVDDLEPDRQLVTARKG